MTSFDASDPGRALASRGGDRVALAEFRRAAGAVARSLPASGSMINLCEDRYNFLAAYAAALSVGHVVLLPPARAERILQEIESANPGAYRLNDSDVNCALRATNDESVISMTVPDEQTVMIGFTSGTTGQPKPHRKVWGGMVRTIGLTGGVIRDALGSTDGADPWIVATVPPQHMYGMELSILLPLLARMAVHAGRPLFPADIAAALSEVPEPRVLVSTPMHLRAMIDSGQEFPRLALIISATAPLDEALAARVERRLGGPLLELFGSTETCVIAHRRTTSEKYWRLHAGVQLEPVEDGTYVSAPWVAQPVLLQDIVELHPGGQFILRGRNADMIEVAGKRASLADLTRRILAIPGVQDAVVFQPEPAAVASIRRVAALVVAPGLGAREILGQLTASVDPAFRPRPLLVVEALPRNELGKLPRASLSRLVRKLEIAAGDAGG